MGQAQVFMEEQNKLPELLIKLAEGATMPSKANLTDSGYDLVATSVRYDEEYGFLEYGTGVFLQIPEGYEVNLLPRSSISKYDLFMCNAPGKVDESYRKELFFRFKVTVDYEFARLDKNDDLCCSREGIPVPFYPRIYRINEKIGQMEMRKKHVYTLKQVEDVNDEGREGFGSTGR